MLAPMTEEDDRPRKKPATYQDVLDAPEHLVAEIIDDELYLSPRPAAPHSNAELALGAILKQAFDWGRGGPGGWIILSEPELHFERDVLVPDLAGWRRERLARVPDAAYITLAPDWVCEVLSPSTKRLDRLKKIPVYAREGVRYAWLVEPLRRTVEVFECVSTELVRTRLFQDEAVARVPPFEQIDIEFSLLFPELEQDAS